MILEELKHKCQEILAHQRENSAANKEKSKERAKQMKALTTERA